MEKANLGSKKFFFGREKRFGMNMQAICDHKRRFLDIDIAQVAYAGYLFLQMFLVDIMRDNIAHGVVDAGKTDANWW